MLQRGQVAVSPVMLGGGMKAEQDALEQYVGFGVASSRTRSWYEETKFWGRKCATVSTEIWLRQHLNGFFAFRACWNASVVIVSGERHLTWVKKAATYV